MRYCLGDWLARPLDTITRRDVEARFHRVSQRNGWAVANHIIALLRSVYRRPCVDHETLRNPVDLWLAGGGRYHRAVRRRISTPAETLPRWWAAIEAEVTVAATRDIFWFGMYTGMRRGEIMGLRWDRVDRERRIFRVEATKTGEPLELPITRQLAALLRAPPPGGWCRYRRRLAVGVPLDRGVGPRDRAATSLSPDQPGGRDQVLVPRAPERVHHGGGAGVDAATVADQAAGQPRPRQ